MNTTTKNVTGRGETPHKYVFGEFVLDLDRGALLRNNADVPLRPKCFEVLCYLVDHPGALLSKDELLTAIWADVIVTEDSLTQCMIEIRMALGDDRKEVIRNVPRRGYLFDVPVTVIGPGERPQRSKPSVSKRHRKPSTWSVGAAIVLALAIFATWFSGRQAVDEVRVRGPEIVALPASIAVLPFTDMSPGHDQEYLAEGLSEEILNLLAQSPDLTVIARTSSFSFKGQNPDIQTIARKLNVANVLEGSVRKEGDVIRVTAQLVETVNSAHLWSKTYDRTLDNVLSVQSEIAGAVARELKVALQGKTVSNSEAYQAYLRGRYLISQRTHASTKSAIEEFKKAVSFDPGYALAYAELSLANRRLSFSGEMTRAEAIGLAKPYAERAMALDPDLAQAHAATGYVWVTPDTLEIAVDHFRRAIELNPNYADAYLWLGVFLNLLGQYEEAFLAQENAVRLDPLSRPANSNYAQGLIERNRLDEADWQMEKLASFAPSFYAASDLPAIRNTLGGHWADGLIAELNSLQVNDNSTVVYMLARNLAIIGLEQEALALFDTPPPYILAFLGNPEDWSEIDESRLANDPRHEQLTQDFGLALALAGEYARARILLEKAWQQSDNLVTVDGFTTEAALALIVIRRDAGEEAGVGELLAAIQDNVRRYQEAGIIRGNLFWNVNFETGIAAFLAGDRERGLALIARGAEDGFFIHPKAAFMQMFHDEPGFASILADQQARQSRERARFLKVVCSDNPYQDVWRPLPGSCNRHFANSATNQGSELFQ